MKSSHQLQSIRFVDLLIDSENPRYEQQDNQRECLETLVRAQGPKLIYLAEDIAIHGLNPSEVPIVMKSAGSEKFVVLEGNRRIAAIKLLSQPQLVDTLPLSSSVAKKLKSLHSKFESTLSQDVQCLVVSSRDEARRWIELRHLGESNGVGIIGWNGLATMRFRGESPELQLLAMVEDSEYLDEKTRTKMENFPVTNLQRLLSTADARKYLGIDVAENQLRLVESEDEVVGRLAIVVSDLANKHIKVTQLDSKDQRILYAKEVARRPLPSKGSAIAATIVSAVRVQAKKSTRTTRKRKKERSTLIPRSLDLNISLKRVFDIFLELRSLKIETFPNSCAVLLRVFVEMSVDDYASRNRIPLIDTKRRPPRDFSLAKKILIVAANLLQTGKCEKDALKAVRQLAQDKDKVFSIDTFNAYVHNKHYNPAAKDLKHTWDNIQPFVEALWTQP